MKTIIQFHKENNKIRFVNKALEDGYKYGDKFLEGVMFIVSINDKSEVCVEPTKDARSYLEDKFCDCDKWSNLIKESLEENGSDCLTGIEETENDEQSELWDNDELHLIDVDEINFYTDDGFEIVKE